MTFIDSGPTEFFHSTQLTSLGLAVISTLERSVSLVLSILFKPFLLTWLVTGDDEFSFSFFSDFPLLFVFFFGSLGLPLLLAMLNVGLFFDLSNNEWAGDEIRPM